MADQRVECACDDCKACCDNTPGWFAPGEATAAAQANGMTLEEFFQRALVADYWLSEDSTDVDIFVLRPAKAGEQAGQVAPINLRMSRGRCVFLTWDRRCAIHATKPSECAITSGCGKVEDESNRRPKIAPLWRSADAQAEIATVLGADARVPQPTFGDMLDLMLAQIERLENGEKPRKNSRK